MTIDTKAPEFENEVVEAMYLSGFSLTRAQVREVLDSDHGNEVHEIVRALGEFETSARFTFLDALAAFVGVPGEWPTNGEPDEYRKWFAEQFAAGCSKHGISYDPSSIAERIAEGLSKLSRNRQPLVFLRRKP